MSILAQGLTVAVKKHLQISFKKKTIQAQPITHILMIRTFHFIISFHLQMQQPVASSNVATIFVLFKQTCIAHDSNAFISVGEESAGFEQEIVLLYCNIHCVIFCLTEVIMGSAVERTDEHVREYLIYRGFTSTLKHLDSDIKADKEKGFRVRSGEMDGSVCSD